MSPAVIVSEVVEPEVLRTVSPRFIGPIRTELFSERISTFAPE